MKVSRFSSMPNLLGILAGMGVTLQFKSDVGQAELIA
jgi:hypothetical protein